MNGKYKVIGMNKEGYNIKEAKIGNKIVYAKEEENTFYVEYRVSAINKPLNTKNSTYGVTYYLGLPRVNNSINYEKIEITLLDGTVTDKLTTYMDEIDKVKLWYNEETTSLKFEAGTYGINYHYIKELIKINTKNFLSFSYMFRCCSLLTSLDLSKWNTINVTDMSNMFYCCISLTSLDLSKWNTSNVTNMNNMFYVCEKLTSLDLSNFDTSKVTSYSNMFYNVPSTCEIYIGEKFTLTEEQTNFSGNFIKNYFISSYNLNYNKENNSYEINVNFERFKKDYTETPNLNWQILDKELNFKVSDDTLTCIISLDKEYEAGEYICNVKYSLEGTDYSNEFNLIMNNELIIDFSKSTSMPNLPSWFSVYDNSSTYKFNPGTFTTDVYGLVPSNKGVSSSTAWSVYKIVAPENKKLKITYRAYSEKNYDYLTIHLTTTTSQPSYSSTTNLVLSTKENYSYTIDSTTTYSTSLVSGNTYYLHVQYRKDGSGNTGYDMGCIRKIELVDE